MGRHRRKEKTRDVDLRVRTSFAAARLIFWVIWIAVDSHRTS